MITGKFTGFTWALITTLVFSAGVAHADARSDLFAAYQKMQGAKFSSVTATTDAHGKITKAHADYDSLQRIHIKTDAIEMIVVPEGVWMGSGSDGWQKPPVDMSGMLKRFLPSTLEEIKNGTRNVKDEGKTAWNGQAVDMISYDIDTKIMGFAVRSRNKVYIDSKGNIVHSESDSEAMGRKTHSSQDIHYDDSIRVVAPSG